MIHEWEKSATPFPDAASGGGHCATARLPATLDAVPELPDLEYIVEKLRPRLTGRRIEEVTVKEPIVIRMLLPDAGGFTQAMRGRELGDLTRVGPFLDFSLSGDTKLVVHCMLTGRLQIAAAADKPVAHLCFGLRLDNGEWLRYGDDKKMGKVYLVAEGQLGEIPGYQTQGVSILSPRFTWELFQGIMAGRRHQVRVFLMDQTALSAIGNAYADEILFAARIHPKTPCNVLSVEEQRVLYDSIRSVMAWGIEEVKKAGRPIEQKVRDHVRVRNRRNEPCPVCGTTIRRVGVLGYDSFFCPTCQPAVRLVGPRSNRIPW
jgi:formamidopyrimidine-DNA glycosylase